MERNSLVINTLLDIRGYEFKPDSTYVVGVTLSKNLSNSEVCAHMCAIKDAFNHYNISVILYPKGYGIDDIEVLEANE